MTGFFTVFKRSENLSWLTLYVVGSVKDSSTTGWSALVAKTGIRVIFGVLSISSEVLGSCCWDGFGWARPKMVKLNKAKTGLCGFGSNWI